MEAFETAINQLKNIKTDRFAFYVSTQSQVKENEYKGYEIIKSDLLEKNDFVFGKLNLENLSKFNK